MSFEGTRMWNLFPLAKARVAVAPVSSLYTKLSSPAAGCLSDRWKSGIASFHETQVNPTSQTVPIKETSQAAQSVFIERIIMDK